MKKLAITAVFVIIGICAAFGWILGESIYNAIMAFV